MRLIGPIRSGNGGARIVAPFLRARTRFVLDLVRSLRRIRRLWDSEEPKRRELPVSDPSD